MPIFKFTYKKVKDVEYSADEAFVDYGNGSYIKVNIPENIYEISVNGVTVGKDFTTSVEWGVIYYAYSGNGGKIEVKLPDNYKKVTVTALPKNEKNDIKTYDIKDGLLKLKADPKTPYVIKKV